VNPDNQYSFRQDSSFLYYFGQDNISETLIKAVVAQRSLKSQEEIEQIEAALEVSYEMQTAARY